MPTIKLRRGVAADWITANPVLDEGEIGYEKDTKLFKIGDGTSNFSALEYYLRTSDLPAAVNPLVSQAISQDPTIVSAAVDAMDTAISEAGLLEGASNINSLEDDVAFVITDVNGRRSWLEVAKDGGPTVRVKDILTQLAKDGVGLVTSKPTALSRAFSIVGLSDREALYIDDAGAVGIPKFDSATAKRITDLVVPLVSGNASQYKDPQGVSYPLVSGPDFYHPGDSLTNTGYVPALAALTGKTHHNGGVGGENSSAIAARTNALPYMMMPVGGTIPASGAVDVTFTPFLGGDAWPLLQGSGGTASGVLAGVPVTLSIRVKDPAVGYPSHGAGDIYQITRTTAGSAVPVPKPTAFYWDFGKARRGDVMIAWIGQNQSGTPVLPQEEVVLAAAEAMVQNLTPAVKRYLFMTQTGVKYTGLSPLELSFTKRFGPRFLNVRRYLIDHAMSDLGITPTAEDLQAQAEGNVPRSLTTDGLHHTAAAAGAIAQYLVYPRLQELGWI